MQLVAYGAQDVYLTGNPQITFFKVVYRRHTNFSMECIQQTINGSSSVPNGGNANVTISRNGDLVGRVFVAAEGVNGQQTAGALNSAIGDCEIEIGGQKIDKIDQAWRDIWAELSTPESKALSHKALSGDIGNASMDNNNIRSDSGVAKPMFPLPFWFCRNPGLALPLIALQYHEVKIKISLGQVNGGAGTWEVWADYVYLDTDERRRFAQVSHEYLIEQVQFHSLANANTTKLNFNHPVKELIWTGPPGRHYASAKLVLNGHDRFAAQNAEYFRLKQPLDYHTAVPRQNLPTAARNSLLDRQTIVVTPQNNAAAYTVQNLADNQANGVQPNNSDIFLSAAGVLTISGAAALSAPEFAVGQQIAITIQTVQQAGGVSVDILGGNSQAAATTPAVGDVYFATVTVAAAQGAAAGILTMSISTPSTVLNPTIKTFTTLTDNAGGNAGTTVSILRVTNGSSTQARTSRMTNHINVYSFALKPEEHQPSGTCNFSRIDTAQLVFTGPNTPQGTTNDVVYAVNYNVLRIMSGMGGLAYSN